MIEFRFNSFKLLSFLLNLASKNNSDIIYKILINIVIKLQQDIMESFCIEMGQGDSRLNSQKILLSLRENILQIVSMINNNKDSFISDFWMYILELIGLAGGETTCYDILIKLLKNKNFPLKEFKILYSVFEKNFSSLDEYVTFYI